MSAGTVTITEFLEARIAEDEARANYYGALALGTTRVLAECAAKRAIIKQAQNATDAEKEFDDYEWQDTVSRSEPYAGDAILYALAAVYADHQDYQQEWAL